jgi:CRISPR/Cas system-associated protein endoribonuclease Cas2
MICTEYNNKSAVFGKGGTKKSKEICVALMFLCTEGNHIFTVQSQYLVCNAHSVEITNTRTKTLDPKYKPIRCLDLATACFALSIIQHGERSVENYNTKLRSGIYTSVS